MPGALPAFVLALALAVPLLLAANPAAAQASTPPKPESRDQAEDAIAAIEHKVAVGTWKTTRNKDGTISHSRTDARHVGEQGGTYTVQSDGTIVHRWENLKSDVSVTYLPNGDIRKDYRSSVNGSASTTIWKADGTVTVVSIIVSDDGTQVISGTVIKADGSSEWGRITLKPGQPPVPESGSTPSSNGGGSSGGTSSGQGGPPSDQGTTMGPGPVSPGNFGFGFGLGGGRDERGGDRGSRRP